MNNTTVCLKCNGSKKIYRYSNIANGDCFECGATGRVSVSSATRKSTAPAFVPEAPAADRVVDQMRVWYKCARYQGAAWFCPKAEGESGIGMSAVRWHMQFVDTATAARILAAFEALAAEVG